MKTETLVALAEAKTEDTDVRASLYTKYAPDPDRKWWVIRVSYGRIYKACEILKKEGAEYYLPLHHVIKQVEGKSKRVTEPLLPSLIFVYASESFMQDLMDMYAKTHYISYYYNHFARTSYGKNPPLTVDYDSMMNFIAISSIDNEHIRLVDHEHCHYKAGDNVRITAGEFKGIEGRVARVAGQQRVVVELNGLCMIATAYIPSAFMEPVNP
jgi:transcription antitermination factor NusG